MSQHARNQTDDNAAASGGDEFNCHQNKHNFGRSEFDTFNYGIEAVNPFQSRHYLSA